MNYVLYHKNCMDGVGARYAAWKALGDENTKYIPVQYNEPFPDIDLSDNDHVYIVDFSYSREILVGIANYTRLTVIDHHASAEKALGDLPFAIFDMEKSGAVLTWEYFHPSTKIPYFLQILQDYDLWNWELPETLAVTNMFQSDTKREDMTYLDKLVDSCDYVNLVGMESIANIVNQPTISSTAITSHSNQKTIEPYTFMFYHNSGDLAGRAMSKSMKELVDKKKYTVKEIDGLNVAIFNTTEFFSMLGHVACGIEGIDYSISYFFKPDGEMVLSFRAKKGGVNVANIAESYGGGGHQGAAGAVIKRPLVNEVLSKFYD